MKQIKTLDAFGAPTVKAQGNHEVLQKPKKYLKFRTPLSMKATAERRGAEH
jgi:hypothetical protein